MALRVRGNSYFPFTCLFALQADIIRDTTRSPQKLTSLTFLGDVD
jgi:hypothetical protein